MRSVDFHFSPKVHEWQQRLAAFMDEHVYPNEARFPCRKSPMAIAGSRRRSSKR